MQSEAAIDDTFTVSYFQMSLSCELYEKTTNHLGSLLQVVSTKLTLSSSRMSSSSDGESVRRRSREQSLRRGRSTHSSKTAGQKNKKEKHLARSQSCAVQDKLSLDTFSSADQKRFENKEKEEIKNEKSQRKRMRSKSTAFEFRDVIKPRIEGLHPEVDPDRKDGDQTNLHVKHKNGKTLRRIKTFLRRPRKYQFESDTKTDSFKYCK